MLCVHDLRKINIPSRTFLAALFCREPMLGHVRNTHSPKRVEMQIGSESMAHFNRAMSLAAGGDYSGEEWGPSDVGVAHRPARYLHSRALIPLLQDLPQAPSYLEGVFAIMLGKGGGEIVAVFWPVAT